MTNDDSRDLIGLCQQFPFSIPLLDFAQEIDSILAVSLSDRMNHIVGIVKQAFGVHIESHRMYDKLTALRQRTVDGSLVMKHNKDVKEDLSKYVTDTDNLCRYPKSTPFCLPIVLQPVFTRCPQYVNAFSWNIIAESVCFI